MNHLGFPLPLVITNASSNDWHFQVLILVRNTESLDQVFFELGILDLPEFFTVVFGIVPVKENHDLLMPVANVALVFLREDPLGKVPGIKVLVLVLVERKDVFRVFGLAIQHEVIHGCILVAADASINLRAVGQEQLVYSLSLFGSDQVLLVVEKVSLPLVVVHFRRINRLVVLNQTLLYHVNAINWLVESEMFGHVIMQP